MHYHRGAREETVALPVIGKCDHFGLGRPTPVEAASVPAAPAPVPPAFGTGLAGPSRRGINDPPASSQTRREERVDTPPGGWTFATSLHTPDISIPA